MCIQHIAETTALRSRGIESSGLLVYFSIGNRSFSPSIHDKVTDLLNLIKASHFLAAMFILSSGQTKALPVFFVVVKEKGLLA